MDFKRIAVSVVATAGLAIAVIPGAMAQSLHFGVFGGISSVDLSKAEYDEAFTSATEFQFGGTAEIDSSSMDDRGAAWGIQIGYDWNSYVALELGYVDLGSALYEADIVADNIFFTGILPVEFKHESTGPTLALLGMYPLNEMVTIHGRAGIYFSDTRLSADVAGVTESQKGSDEDVNFGLGASWNFSDSHALRFEYQRFLDVGNEDKTGERDVDLLSVTFLFR